MKLQAMLCPWASHLSFPYNNTSFVPRHSTPATFIYTFPFCPFTPADEEQNELQAMLCPWVTHLLLPYKNTLFCHLCACR